MAGADAVITLPMSEITEVLVSFNLTMPVLFIHLNPDEGMKVRAILQMTDPNSSYYFAPESDSEFFLVSSVCVG